MAASLFQGLKEYASLRPYADRVSLVLGSGSFTRKQILQHNGFKFHVIKADIDERRIGDRSKYSSPSDLVRLLAEAKADAVLAKLEDANQYDDKDILLTADQVVVHDHRILEKPVDEEEARSFISMYSNDKCSTVGSIALTHLSTRRRVIGVDTATINFLEIPQDTVDKIISEGTCLQCAGGLMVEHDLLQPYIASVQGTTDSVMGLSCPLLESLFAELDQMLYKTS